ncbi:MAG: hypothetical protein HKN72_00625 [Gemmatimonadetes bacterium]|nr:hypothetical protein [Gemmatimonadota bacterium]
MKVWGVMIGVIFSVAGVVEDAIPYPHATLSAQNPPPQLASPLQSVALSDDSVEIGDRFDLRLELRLRPDEVAFFPDSLAAPGIEPFDAVAWGAETQADGSIVLTISYPLLAYQTGPVLVPDFDAFVAPRAEALVAGYADDGELVGSWDAFRAAPARVPSARLLGVPPRQVMVATVLGLDDITTQITPRPPADLSGGNRDWLSTLLLAVFGVLLSGIAVSSTRDWMRYRARVPPPPPPTPKERALAALAEVEASGMHADGRLRVFYSDWSEAVRRYVESFQTAWGPAWTSTELMTDLQGPRRSAAVERSVGPEEIAGVMRTAEEVKFGGVRPDPEAALGHLQRARGWIEGSDPGGPAAGAPTSSAPRTPVSEEGSP